MARLLRSLIGPQNLAHSGRPRVGPGGLPAPSVTSSEGFIAKERNPLFIAEVDNCRDEEARTVTTVTAPWEGIVVTKQDSFMRPLLIILVMENCPTRHFPWGFPKTHFDKYLPLFFVEFLRTKAK